MSAVLSDRNASRVDTLRVPPHSMESEQSVLGGVMLVPKALAKISDWLKPEDFYSRQHRLIYETLIALASKGEPIDIITVGEHLEANGLTEQVGGAAYVTEVAGATPSAANIEAYAEIVLERSKLRKAIEIGTTIAGDAFGRGAQSEAVIASGLRQLSLMQTSRLRGGLKSTRELMPGWIKGLNDLYMRGEAISGMPTPWAGLNALTHGLQDGECVIIAGRPNMGKSIMGLQLALHAALNLGRRAAIFSMEMTTQQVIRRMTAALANVPHDSLKSPKLLTEEQWKRVMDANVAIGQAPLMIDDTPRLTIDQLEGRARRAHMQAPIGLLVTDHLHEFHLRNPKDKAYELGDIAARTKALGKEFGCPAVLLAQLNRDLTKRDIKRPEMSDLRESGAIEEKADVIIFVHRDDYYDRKSKRKGVVEAIIGKGRDVKTGEKANLRNRFDVMRMDDFGPYDLLAEDHEEEEAPEEGFKKGSSKPRPRDRVAEAYDK